MWCQGMPAVAHCQLLHEPCASMYSVHPWLRCRTSENFRCLCTVEKGVGQSGRKLWFKGSAFHRIIPDFMCQASSSVR